ncbi:lipid phosphate phosphatase 1 [Heliocybe sulcata]|uniref:Lipid phosphate phosphatase 1 n=1 Tax=Heliocybe sulcata TaxID=5364 RepID=A0A5C3N465_9AGAM|nr:lipid phosphate phosphatase 1 [Heliocybe sulcata]
MAALTRVQDKVKELFGRDSLDWLSVSYVIDWLVASAFFFLGNLVSHLAPFEREFSPDDPTISHKHHSNQISGTTNGSIALYIPLIITTAVCAMQRSAIGIHHSALALWAGRSLAKFTVECLKNRVGRLRPDFLARCKWDAAAETCTGKAASIMDGRRSFPSGHSSTAFAGMTFLALWLAGQTTAWCFTAPVSGREIAASRLGRLLLTLAPLAWATWVAVSRLEDYRHHKEDVIVGAFIGTLCSGICYFIYWPSPFSADSFTPERVGQPRATYAPRDYHERSNGGFELTRLQDDTEHV